MSASQTMRAMLANAGIFLDEKSAIAPAAPPATLDPPVDRSLVREILRDRGAPGRDLDWLASSCPSIEHALAFEPTPWMVSRTLPDGLAGTWTRDFTDYLTERPSAAKGRP